MAKEKFKLIKLTLNLWHSKHVQNLPGRISSLKERIALLCCKGETKMLSDGEIKELCGLTDDLHSLSRIITSICWQQSRL